MKSIALFPAVSLPLLAILVLATHAAPGDWPEPRRDGSLTGIQPLPGNLQEAPDVIAEWDTGRSRPSLSAVLAPGATDEYWGVCLFQGALSCFDQEGGRVWELHPPGLNFSSLVAIDDFNGDGDKEILLKAGRTAEPFGAATLVSLDTGELLWRYDVDPMSYAWYLFAEDYLGDGRKQIVVMMHGYPPDKDNGYIALFQFEGESEGEGSKAPVQSWRYDFDDYTCFPSLLRTDLDGDGVDELCVETHSRMWLFDARTGERKQFTGWDVSPANVRSYGHVEFVDLNADGREDFLCIATFAQHHEVLLNRNGKFEKAWSHGWSESVTTGKVVSTWPSPPYADVDGDGRLELAVSMYNSEEEEGWLLRIYDAETGELEYKKPGVVASVLEDLDGDGVAEIGCNRSQDPTENNLDGALVLSFSKGLESTVWEDTEAAFPIANKRSARPPNGFVYMKEGKRWVLEAQSGSTGTINSIRDSEYVPPPVPPSIPFPKTPALVAAPPPTLLAANLVGDERNELISYREPKIEVRTVGGDGALSLVREYVSDSLPVIVDLDGDGRNEIVTGEVDPNKTPTIEARTPSLEDRVLWSLSFPETDRAGLPQPRKLYVRSGHFLGSETPDLYVLAGTPVVRGVVLRGTDGDLAWETGEVPSISRYNGPTVDLASVNDFDQDGCEDLVFTNPDYYCVTDGRSGDFLIRPFHPPRIFGQPSQGLYTFPAILDEEGARPNVALVSGHYFQAAMSIDARPDWYKLPVCGENPCSTEGFLRNREGDWLMGFGRQNGKFACVEVDGGALRWELDVQASCSDTIACDIDGDGEQEFLFGTSHGDLYAVRDGGEAPVVVWKKELSAGTGAPIAADFNGDGASEIAVPQTDGRVRILGRGRP